MSYPATDPRSGLCSWCTSRLPVSRRLAFRGRLYCQAACALDFAAAYLGATPAQLDQLQRALRALGW